jgi:8-oxo-dGTP diphosphatase
MRLSVKVFILDAAGRVLVLRRSAASKNHAGRWDFPGGKTDPGETFEEALRREVREETGLVIALTHVIGADESVVADRHIAYLFVEGTLVPGEAAAARLSDEHDAAQWVAPNQLPELDLAPQFRRIASSYGSNHGPARAYP